MRVLTFGASGSAGASVLKVCLAEPSVTALRAMLFVAREGSSNRIVENRDIRRLAERRNSLPQTPAAGAAR